MYLTDCLVWIKNKKSARIFTVSEGFPPCSGNMILHTYYSHGSLGIRDTNKWKRQSFKFSGFYTLQISLFVYPVILCLLVHYLWNAQANKIYFMVRRKLISYYCDLWYKYVNKCRNKWGQTKCTQKRVRTQFNEPLSTYYAVNSLSKLLFE